ncbi:Uncharacterized membrane protein [Flavobacterium fontis]|uniref:Uncharacterized membrane protein n=1 Tax=Flavobacterium fontis TaxID=1124188 RepID=A0A1M4ZAG7_9FLAO|nr:DUF2231 domain-containing protein [Flavobacterium fontis]SHF14948.1 Uncharacterized membrane protein [Flavobacterium fontis]
MNEAHLHLVVNHFPIVGVIFGFLLLVGSLVFRNKTLQNTAYFLFIISAVTTLVSMQTGEGAEEIVEEMPEIGHDIIHEHEEIAEKMALVMYALGGLSLAGWYMNTKENAKAKWVALLATLVSIAGMILGSLTGTSGGEIRHTEIREATTQSPVTQEPTESHEE